jgi:hypothetical protein
MGVDPTPLNLPKKPNYKPVLLTILCSFLLGAGSCFGFLTTLNFNRNVPINGVFAVGFGICLLVFLGSILWLVIKAIRDAVRPPRDTS